MFVLILLILFGALAIGLLLYRKQVKHKAAPDSALSIYGGKGGIALEPVASLTPTAALADASADVPTDAAVNVVTDDGTSEPDQVAGAVMTGAADSHIAVEAQLEDSQMNTSALSIDLSNHSWPVASSSF